MGGHTLEETIPVRLITLNIRYANPRPVPGEALWSTRGPKLCNQLRFATAGYPTAFICLQEALDFQVAGILAELRGSNTTSSSSSSSSASTTDWRYIGVGRDDGVAAGEFSPVFYNAAEWRCVHSTTYWLSPTPTTPGSRGWDAALPRIVTMGAFEARRSRARVVVLSTHFDHQGVRAREESAKLILSLAAKWTGESAGMSSARGRPPVFLGGDFNSSPSDKAYQTMTAANTGMTDISTLIPKDQRYGNELTYSSFGEKGEVPKRIDFLFVKDTSGIKFHTYGVLANRFDDGIYLSDHRATVADVDIPIKGQSPSR